MRSHSFQDRELTRHRYVKFSKGQVVESEECYDSTVPPEGSRIKGYSLKKPKFNVHSHSFQDTKLKLHRYANDSTEEVVKRLTILP